MGSEMCIRDSGNTVLIYLSSTLLANISPIGIIKVMRINAKRGKTNRNALILFLFSAFLKLTFNGIPSLVSIGPDNVSLLIK